MNADKDKLDSLTERVLGAVFEVTNTLGAGFLEESLPASAAQRTRPSRHPGYRRSFIYSHLQESLCRRLLCRSARRRRVGGRAEMYGTALQRAHSAVSQLSASLRPDRLSSRQFPEAQGRVEAYRPSVSGFPSRLKRRLGRSLLNLVAHLFRGHYTRVLNGFGGTRPGEAFPVGQTLGQTASFRQTAPETWCQSRVCGVSRPASPKTVKHPADCGSLPRSGSPGIGFTRTDRRPGPASPGSPCATPRRPACRRECSAR